MGALREFIILMQDYKHFLHNSKSNVDMVLILDGKSEIGAHVWSNLGN